MQEANDSDNGSNQVLLSKALDETIYSLGAPIYKTITWHMNNKGFFTDSKNIDVVGFYSNLKELVGPGADMIMEETWHKLKKAYKGELDAGGGTPLDRIMRIINSDKRIT